MTYNPNFSGKANISSIQTSETNSSGSTIDKLTPVRIDSFGNMATINVSTESEALSIAGLLDADAADGASANIATSGRIMNVTVAGAGFGDTLYVSKTGGITNVKPDIGVGSFVAGDFVIRVGMVAKNAENPSNKDVIVMIQIVGQL